MAKICNARGKHKFQIIAFGKTDIHDFKEEGKAAYPRDDYFWVS